MSITVTVLGDLHNNDNNHTTFCQKLYQHYLTLKHLPKKTTEQQQKEEDFEVEEYPQSTTTTSSNELKEYELLKVFKKENENLVNYYSFLTSIYNPWTRDNYLFLDLISNNLNLPLIQSNIRKGRIFILLFQLENEESFTKIVNEFIPKIHELKKKQNIPIYIIGDCKNLNDKNKLKEMEEKINNFINDYELQNELVNLITINTNLIENQEEENDDNNKPLTDPELYQLIFSWLNSQEIQEIEKNHNELQTAIKLCGLENRMDVVLRLSGDGDFDESDEEMNNLLLNAGMLSGQYDSDNDDEERMEKESITQTERSYLNFNNGYSGSYNQSEKCLERNNFDKIFQNFKPNIYSNQFYNDLNEKFNLNNNNTTNNNNYGTNNNNLESIPIYLLNNCDKGILLTLNLKDLDFKELIIKKKDPILVISSLIENMKNENELTDEGKEKIKILSQLIEREITIEEIKNCNLIKNINMNLMYYDLNDKCFEHLNNLEDNKLFKKENKIFKNNLVNNLPIEILSLISEYLQQQDIFNLMLCCKQFNQLNNYDNLFESLVKRNWNILKLPKEYNNWKDFYNYLINIYILPKDKEFILNNFNQFKIKNELPDDLSTIFRFEFIAKDLNNLQFPYNEFKNKNEYLIYLKECIKKIIRDIFISDSIYTYYNEKENIITTFVISPKISFNFYYLFSYIFNSTYSRSNMMNNPVVNLEARRWLTDTVISTLFYAMLFNAKSEMESNGNDGYFSKDIPVDVFQLFGDISMGNLMKGIAVDLTADIEYLLKDKPKGKLLIFLQNELELLRSFTVYGSNNAILYLDCKDMVGGGYPFFAGEYKFFQDLFHGFFIDQ
ncbi:hypothetical protein ABK040_000431 [Willaertia magna]